MSDARQLVELVRDLASRPAETEWLERKHNNADPQQIGEYLSALSNAAALCGRRSGYLLWGVTDGTHEVVGTTFRPATARKGNQPLHLWLARQLEPRVDFQFHELEVSGAPVVLLEVQAAHSRPTAFSGQEYIRIGSAKTGLRQHPEKERALWSLRDARPFERQLALESVSAVEVSELLDCAAYFRLVGEPVPTNPATVLERCCSEGMATSQGASSFGVTNLGAILFARDLGRFPRLDRKALRLVFYAESSRVRTTEERLIAPGYAVGFEEAMAYLAQHLPHSEQVERAVRREVRMYPDLAVRELVANALIHQDFAITGAGPIVEAFADRVEVTNPGLPLIDTRRFIDEPPRSRNESLASMMRRLGMCEERGSGIDKVISEVELHQLPAPDFRATAGSTVAVLFGERPFGQMARADRIRACYQHACLQYVSGQAMTNASLRQRFGISDSDYPLASRIIRDTVDDGLVKLDEASGMSKRYARYLPFWA